MRVTPSLVASIFTFESRLGHTRVVSRRVLANMTRPFPRFSRWMEDIVAGYRFC